MKLLDVKDNQDPEMKTDKLPKEKGKKRKLVKKDNKTHKSRKVSRKVIFMTSILVLVVVGIGCGIWFGVLHTRDQEAVNGIGQFGNFDNMAFGENVITASGTTSIGMDVEELDVDYLTTEIEVEEVYLSSGDRVDVGTRILKLNEESVAEALTTLERAAKEAELAYREGAITLEAQKLEAQSSYQSTLIAKDYILAEYQNSLNEAEQKVDKTKEQYEEAVDLVNEYEEAITNDGYYTEYNMDYLYNTYYENKAILNIKQNEWGITDAQLSDYGKNPNTSDPTGTLKALYQLKCEVEENEKEYETAKTEYENAVESANVKRAAAHADIELKQIAYEQAKIEYETSILKCESDYSANKAKIDSAQDSYDTELQKIEDDLTELEDTKNETAENLEDFKNRVGDGYLYCEGTGTIMMLMVSDETVISGSTVILAYSNLEDVTVSVAVDQANIASVEVGMEAYVIISDMGNYEGTVREINPVSTSTSRSTVTYTVTVELAGDVTSLTANLSAAVYIGDGVDEMVNRSSGGNRGNRGMYTDISQGDISGNEQMPEGVPMLENGRMPEKMTIPSDGQMPDGTPITSDGQITESVTVPEANPSMETQKKQREVTNL